MHRKWLGYFLLNHKHFLLDRKYPKTLSILSRSVCLSQICPKVSHSMRMMELDSYEARADTAGHPVIQNTNNTHKLALRRQRGFLMALKVHVAGPLSCVKDSLPNTNTSASFLVARPIVVRYLIRRWSPLNFGLRKLLWPWGSENTQGITSLWQIG